MFRDLDNAKLEDIKDEIHEVERMLKSLIKSLENKSSNPGPLSPNWEKNQNTKNG